MTLLIRDAIIADAAGILPIYNHAALETTAIWNEGASDLAGREAWLAARQHDGFPVLVAEIGQAIVGYGSFGAFRAFDGYRHTVEHSTYVHPDHQRLGIGRAMLVALIQRARDGGKHAMIGAIESGNTASIALHESLGFRQVGLLPQTGAKFGRWLDLALLELILDDRLAP
jgi:L-amino acid N-acyltransferase